MCSKSGLATKQLKFYSGCPDTQFRPQKFRPPPTHIFCALLEERQRPPIDANVVVVINVVVETPRAPFKPSLQAAQALHAKMPRKKGAVNYKNNILINIAKW